MWDAKWKQISSEHDENGACDHLRSGRKAWLAQHVSDHSCDAGTAAEVSMDAVHRWRTASLRATLLKLTTNALRHCGAQPPVAVTGSCRLLSYQFAALTLAEHGQRQPGSRIPGPPRPRGRVPGPMSLRPSTSRMKLICAKCMQISMRPNHFMQFSSKYAVFMQKILLHNVQKMCTICTICKNMQKYE